MLRPLFITLICILLSIPSISQDSLDEETGVQIDEASLKFGPHFEVGTLGDLEDFREQNPGSEFLSQELSGFKESVGAYSTTELSFSGSIGMDLSDKFGGLKNWNPRLRLGLNYFKGAGVRASVSIDESYRIDTLSSSSGNRKLYVDSSYNDIYSMKRRSEHLRLSAELSFNTDPEARFSIYSGLGIMAGIAFHTKTRIDHIEISDRIYHPPDGESLSSRGFTKFSNEKERTLHEIGFGANAYLPIGMELRLGPRQHPWGNVHLFTELTGGMNFTFPKEMDPISNPYLEGKFGIRYRWG